MTRLDREDHNALMSVAPPTIVNFGQNVRFTPQKFYAPQTESELLEVLNSHRDGQIRVVASRHAWSDAIVSADALIDMRHFRAVSLHEREVATFATVGGGCQVKHLLAELNRVGLTTPSVGLITEQTIAGAISTGTHGSGKHSLSHYIAALRIACYGPDGRAMIREVTDGAELRAARCGLGCLGVIAQVTFRCIPQYYVREQAAPCDTIEEALAGEAAAPLQQFFLIPHLWKYFAQRRVVAEQNRASFSASLYRWYWFLNIDLGLHLFIKLFASVLRSPRLVRLLFCRVLPAFIFPRWVVIDRSDKMLVMEHELFRHLEMELFVPASQVVAAARFVEEVLQITAGYRAEPSTETEEQLRSLGRLDSLRSLHGTYTHHYAVCFRRVLADDTLISMSSGDDPWWYAISFITYVQPREPFFELARFLAISTAKLFRARPHWGKWFPLGGDEVERMYPALPEFREICTRFDPRGVFRNAYVTEALRLPAAIKDQAVSGR
ncbi:MAG: D-arabinono-1,4-lactone oxidase [Pirellulaceae bacterium]|nr:D-arabinono-1,4-lactone oxidase [Pirellulaceae bacterium]